MSVLAVTLVGAMTEVRAQKSDLKDDLKEGIDRVEGMFFVLANDIKEIKDKMLK